MALIDFDQKRERDVVIIGRATLDFKAPNLFSARLGDTPRFRLRLL